ncbi:MAG: BadF/BadG/BcrA/BcrD ATPase family protein [Candidatus Izemoplasmatales bacterium]
MKTYIIGIDGGATKTLGILFDLDGNEIKRVEKGFGNFSVNSQETIDHLYAVIDDLICEISLSDLEMIQAGMAGYSNFPNKVTLIEDLKKRYKTKVSITTDAEVAFNSIKRNRDKNVIMILGGTGSVVMFDKGDDDTHLIGGFGHLLGDEGSGYHLAITALKNIINQFEERAEITPLSKSILKKIGAKDYSEIKNFVYNNQKIEIASLSRFIADYANKGNQEAIRLFENEGRLLAKEVIKAYRAMDTSEDVIIGIKGGFLINAPYVKDVLISELNKYNIQYKMDESSVEPIYGAYYLAKSHIDKR